MHDAVIVIDKLWQQVRYDKYSIHSHNLYQIFTYVKNKEAELADTLHEVSGMLLYAKTDEDVQPDNTYQMSGNRISVCTTPSQAIGKNLHQALFFAGKICITAIIFAGKICTDKAGDRHAETENPLRA